MINFQRQTIPLHRTAGNAQYNLELYRYRHPEARLRIYLQAGLHGVEITGIPTLYRLMNWIETEQLPIDITCLPLSNPMGLDTQIMGVQTGYNNLVTNPQNCLNWNRTSQLRAEESIEGHWINRLLELSAVAVYVIDLHCAAAATVPHLYCHHSLVAVAARFGITEIISWENAGTAFEDYCFSRGQSAFTLELSASRSVSESWIADSLDYLQNFIMLLIQNNNLSSQPGQNNVPPGITVWPQERAQIRLYSPQNGILCWDNAPGDRLETGQSIAHLYSGREIIPILSPVSGMLLEIDPIQAPYQHQRIGTLLADEPAMPPPD
jgi:predicted deacylase